MERRASGATPSAAWAPSLRRWRKRRAAMASRSKPAPRSARSSWSESRAAGVALADGRAIRGRALAANVNPKLLYGKLVARDAVPPEFLRTHGALELRLRHLPDECRALETAEFHRPAGRPSRRPPHRRDHPCAQSRLYGPRLCRCPQGRLEPRADHRNADPLHPRRHPGAQGRACREPVLPACRTATSRRPLMGRASRRGRRPDDRDRRPLRARFQGKRDRPPDASRRSTSNAHSASSAATSSTAR